MLYAELARETGSESRKVSLTATSDEVRIHTFDTGNATQLVGSRDGEYEFWVMIEASAFPALLIALLKDKFQGQLDATDQLTSFCKRHGVPCEWMSWS
jgi:hypothetical protein